ncbi:MAG: hypothetical protein ACXVCD_18485 [Pseudobdellovibrionaceae bacterium]
MHKKLFLPIVFLVHSLVLPALGSVELGKCTYEITGAQFGKDNGNFQKCDKDDFGNEQICATAKLESKSNQPGVEVNLFAHKAGKSSIHGNWPEKLFVRLYDTDRGLNIEFPGIDIVVQPGQKSPGTAMAIQTADYDLNVVCDFTNSK